MRRLDWDMTHLGRFTSDIATAPLKRVFMKRKPAWIIMALLVAVPVCSQTLVPGETNTSLKLTFTDHFFFGEVNAYQVQIREELNPGERLNQGRPRYGR